MYLCVCTVLGLKHVGQQIMPSGKKRLGSRRRVPTQVEMPEDLTAANQSSQPEKEW